MAAGRVDLAAGIAVLALAVRHLCDIGAEAADHRNISDTRYAALKGLSRIGTPQVIPVLQKAARDDFNSICRDLARQSVEQLETGTR